MTTDPDRLDAVRRFSAACARHSGLLSGGLLDGPWSLSEARTINQLAQAGSEGTTGSAVASALDLDPGYVSRLLGRLERAGITETVRSATDRRKMIVRLSPHGMDALKEMQAASRTRVAEFLGHVDPADHGELIESMTTIERILEHRDARPRVTYRGHRPGDMGWIVQRHAELYHASHGWDENFEAMVAEICARFLDRYDPSCERSWVAEVDGRRAGAVALVRRSKRIGQLRLLFVEPRARGLGIGARLVSECVGQARHFGYRCLILSTVAGLDSARRLYEAEGFRLTSEEPGHAWGKDHVAQTWELTL